MSLSKAQHSLSAEGLRPLPEAAGPTLERVFELQPALAPFPAQGTHPGMEDEAWKVPTERREGNKLLYPQNRT